VGLALICTAFPGPLLRVATGSVGPASISILRGMVWALTPVSLVYVLMAFELAQRRHRIGYALLACAAAYAVGVGLWHGSVLQVIAVLGAVNWAGLVLSALCVLR
jgi:hypothetical protein